MLAGCSEMRGWQVPRKPKAYLKLKKCLILSIQLSAVASLTQ